MKGQFPQRWPVPVPTAARCSGVASRETAGGIINSGGGRFRHTTIETKVQVNK